MTNMCITKRVALLGRWEMQGSALIFKEGALLEAIRNNDTSGEQGFYIMPVSLSLAAKEELLLKAFHEGSVVFIDEINSAPMMERLLNDLLMGNTPDGKKAKNPGFLV